MHGQMYLLMILLQVRFPRGAKQPLQFRQVEGRRWRWACKCSGHATPYRAAWRISRTCGFGSCWHLFHRDKWQLLPFKLSAPRWTHSPHSPPPSSTLPGELTLLSSVASATFFSLLQPWRESLSYLHFTSEGTSWGRWIVCPVWVTFVATYPKTPKSSVQGGRSLVYEWQEMPRLHLVLPLSSN